MQAICITVGHRQNIMEVWLTVLKYNDRYCHPADGILNSTDIPKPVLLSKFPCKNDSVTKKSSEIEIVHQFNVSFVYCTTIVDWVAVKKFKTTKINSLTFHENFPTTRYCKHLRLIFTSIILCTVEFLIYGHRGTNRQVSFIQRVHLVM